jgi:predicted component of type VI protein secretion system
MTKGNNETYIFIIWEKARNKTDEIINDLDKKFVIRNVIEITWSQNEFLNNLKRFYGRSLPDAKEKSYVCGTGPFLVVIVSDINPKFNEPSKSGISLERDYVNSNILNCKLKYRKLIGKKFTIHSSISKNETEHNLTLLFGKNIDDFTKELPTKWDGIIKKIKLDLIGTDGWKNMNELFYVMNGTVNYVVLRNFEGMPSEFDYNDVDLLVEDEKLAYIVKKDFSLVKDNLRSIKIKVGTNNITLNPNYVGDHYYDQKWEKDILKRRVLHDNGFYIPNKSDYFYTLLYHVIFHDRWKKIINIREDYKKLLLNLAKELKLEEVTEISLNNKSLSEIVIKKYMKKSFYKRTDTISYKIRYNESSRLFKTSLFILKTHGIKHLSYAIKEKIKLILKLR